MLQYPLWFGDNSLPDAWQLQSRIEEQKQDNAQLEERNQLLEAEVRKLKSGLEIVEEKARSELGLIKEGETFYRVIENQHAESP